MGLYKGVTPNTVGAGSAWGFYFLFYQTLKVKDYDFFHTNRHQNQIIHSKIARAFFYYKYRLGTNGVVFFYFRFSMIYYYHCDGF